MSNNQSHDPHPLPDTANLPAFLLEVVSPAEARDLLIRCGGGHGSASIWVHSTSPFKDGLLFLPLDVALREAQRILDRETAATWGEYVASCDPDDDVRQTIRERFSCPTLEEFRTTYRQRFPNHGPEMVKAAYRTVEGSPPLDEDPFESDYLWGLEEYWEIPSLVFDPEAFMHGLLPGHIEDRYGEYWDTFEEGETLTMPTAFRDFILEEFRHEGEVVIEDGLLVATCNGLLGDHDRLRRRIAWYGQARELLAALPRRKCEEIAAGLGLPATPPEGGKPPTAKAVKHRRWPTRNAKPRALPRQAAHLLTYRFDIEGLVEASVTCHFVRCKNHDELWADVDGKPEWGSVLRVPRHGLGYDAAAFLLERHLDEPGLPGNCARLQHAGLFGEEVYRKLLDANLAAYRRKVAGVKLNEASRKSALLRVAEELGLVPEPVGSNDVSWYANCPGRNHRLMLSTGCEEFGCGYCKVKGGPAELRALVAERRAARP